MKAINLKDPFEQFIRSILSQHNQADSLRDIANKNKSNFIGTDNLNTFFDVIEMNILAEDYFSDIKINSVQVLRKLTNKMMFLIKKIQISTQPKPRVYEDCSYDKNADIRIIKRFMFTLLEEQKNVNSKFIDFMNSVNKHYYIK